MINFFLLLLVPLLLSFAVLCVLHALHTVLENNRRLTGKKADQNES